MVADAALGRAATQVVLDAVAGEDLDRAVVHLHGEVDGQLAARLAEDAAEAGVEVEPLGGQVELLLGDLPRVDGRGDLLGRHRARWTSGGGAARCAAVSKGWVVSRTTPRGSVRAVSDRCVMCRGEV